MYPISFKSICFSVLRGGRVWRRGRPAVAGAGAGAGPKTETKDGGVVPDAGAGAGPKTETKDGGVVPDAENGTDAPVIFTI
jgi:hypothetical protein